MLNIAVLDDYQNVAAAYGDWRKLGDDCKVTFFDRNIPLSEAPSVLGGFDVLVLMRERMKMPASLIAELPALKLILFTGERTRTIDLAAAAARGIPVCHTRPGESVSATPELAFGLILACVRRIAEEDANIRKGLWQSTVGMTLHERTLGVLGLGKLGARVAQLGKAFGMNIIAWSQNLTPEQAASAGARAVTKEELFEQADVLSIHLVLSERSRGLVGKAEIGRMKRGAMLINTSRGPIVDEEALIDALNRGAIRAGLDVFDQEPLPVDHPLRKAPHTVLTPHLGYVVDSAYREFYEDAIDGILAWKAGKPIRVLAA
jgi:D-3-phosphoglycerate dehydrogenase